MDMIRKQGYSQVTISQICKEARVAKGTFYLYFSSKKDILFEILASINRDMFSERSWESQTDPVLKIQDFLSCYVKIVTRQGYEFSREILKIILEQNPDPAVVESNQHWQTIYEIVREGQEKKIFKEMEPGLLADILQDFLFGTIQRWCTKSGEYSIEDYVADRFQILLDLLIV